MDTSGKHYQKLFVLLFAFVMLLCSVTGAFADTYTVNVEFKNTDNNTSPYNGSATQLYVYLEITDKISNQVIGWESKSFDPNNPSPLVFEQFRDKSENQYYSSFPYTYDSNSYSVTKAGIYSDSLSYSDVQNGTAKTVEGYKLADPDLLNNPTQCTLQMKESNYTVNVEFLDIANKPASYQGTDTQLFVYLEITDKSTNEVAGWYSKEFNPQDPSALKFITFREKSDNGYETPSITFDSEKYTVTKAGVYKNWPTYVTVNNNSAQAIDGYNLITPDYSDPTKVTLQLKDLRYPVSVEFYDTDKEKPLSSYTGDDTNLYVYLEIKDNTNDQTVGWAAQQFNPKSGTPSRTLYFTQFTSTDSDNTTPITYDPALYDISYARLYSEEPTYTIVNDEDPTKRPDDTVDGTKFMDSTYNNTKCTIQLQKWKGSTLYIDLHFDPALTQAITEEDGYWIRAELKHKSGAPTYFITKLTAESGESTKSITAYPWRDDQNFNELPNGKFTGNEPTVTVTIVKALPGKTVTEKLVGSLSINDVAAVLNGDAVKGYTVDYDDGTLSIKERKEDHDDTFTTTCVYNIYLDKNTLEPALTPEDILGEAAEFGIVANRYDQYEHTETNFAVKHFFDDGKNMDIDGSGEDAPIPFYVGDITDTSETGKKVDKPKLWLSADTTVPADIFATSTDIGSYPKEPTKLNITSTQPTNIFAMEQGDINAYVDKLIQAGKNTSDKLASKTTIAPVFEGTGYTVDTTGYPDNTTIYVNADGILNSIGTDGWHIKKLPNQSIVFNITAKSHQEINKDGRAAEQGIYIGQFDVTTTYKGSEITEDSTTSANNGDKEKNQRVDDLILQHITFNVTNAKRVHMNNASALFLLPNADLVTQSNGAGWILAKGTVDSHAEWHFYRHTRSYKAQGDFTLTSKKQLIDITGKVLPFENNNFKFKIFASDSQGNVAENADPIEIALADVNGSFNFHSIKYTEEDLPLTNNNTTGTTKEFYYLIREVIPEDAVNSAGGFTKDGIRYNTSEVKIKVTAKSEPKTIKVTDPDTNQVTTKIIAEISITKVEVIGDTTIEIRGSNSKPPVFSLEDNSIVFTNIKMTSVSASKEWHTSDGHRFLPPAGTKATFRLYKQVNGGELTSTDSTVELDGTPDTTSKEPGYESEKWTATFINLPLYEGESEITYSIGEDTLPGYTISPTTTVADGGTIINTKTGEAGWSVKKFVDGATPAADQKYSFVIQELQSDGRWADIENKQNNGSAINFRDITYKTGGTHWYLIKEKAADSVPGMVPDNSQYIINVEVASDLTETITVYKLNGNENQLVNPDHTINKTVLTELSNGIADIVFNNTMAKGSITLNGTKTVTNAKGTDAKERTFGFSVNYETNPAGSAVATGTVTVTEGAAPENITFTPEMLEYTYTSLEALAAAERATRTPAEGTPTKWEIQYTITENDITDDTLKKEISTAGPQEFTVTCNYATANNQITCSSSTDTTPAAFVNTERNIVSVPISLNKILTGRELSSDDIWNFTIEPYGTNKDTAPLPSAAGVGATTYTVTNTNSGTTGTIYFGNIVFTPAHLGDITVTDQNGRSGVKTYQYHITESQVDPNNPVQNVFLDTQKDFSVTVFLKDDKLEYIQDPSSFETLSFTNKYHTGCSVLLEVGKIINKWPSGTSEFNFILEPITNDNTYDNSLAKIRTALNSETATQLSTKIYNTSTNPTGRFNALTFTEADKDNTFKYVISEDQTGTSAATINGTSYSHVKDGVVYSEDKYNVTITFDQNASDLTPIVKVQKEGGQEETKNGTNNVFSVGSFTNEYKAVGKLNLSVTKGMNIWPTGTPRYTFKLTNGTNTTKLGADGISVNIDRPTDSTTTTITKNFDSIQLTEADAGQIYNFVLTEVVPADRQGVNYDSTNTHNIKVEVAEDGKGNVTPTVTVDNGTAQKATSIDTVFNAGTYTNTYEASGSLALTATKIVEDHDGKEDGERTFSFTLKYADGDKERAATATASTTKDGTEGAGTLSFTPSNVFSYDLSTLQTLVNNNRASGPTAPDFEGKRTWTIKYQLTEDTHTHKDLIQNPTPVDFTVTVTDDGKGTLNCSSDLNENKLSFVNKEWENTKITISGKKVLWDYDTNTALEFRDGDTWSYTIRATGGNADSAPMPTQTSITNDKERFAFVDIPVTTDHLGTNGTDAEYTYTVTESGHVSDVANDPIPERHFKITVSKDAATGKVTAVAAPADQNFTDMDKELTYTNTQHDAKFMQLSVTKAMAKDHWPSGTPNFKFQLTGKKPSDQEKLNSLIPTTLSDSEKSEYWIIDDVTSLKKTVAFPTITFNEEEADPNGVTYNFIVTEIPLNDDEHRGIGYDSMPQHEITVSMNKDMNMTVTRKTCSQCEIETISPEGNVYSAGTFTNTYSASVSLGLRAKKTLSNPNGNTADDHTFTFSVNYAAGDKELAASGSVTVTDGQTKDIVFINEAYNKDTSPDKLYYDLDILDDICIKHGGRIIEANHKWEIDYVLTENESDHEHLIKNIQKFPFTVTLEDDGHGKLTPTSTLDPAKTVFVNTERQNAKLSLSGTKRLVGRAMKPTDKWSFTISTDPREPSSEYAPLPKPATVENNGSSITFGDIIFTPEHVDPMKNGSTSTDYFYLLSESGSVPSVALGEPKGVRVTVSLTAEGNVQAKLQEGVDLGSLLTFINKYHDSGVLHLAVKKTMKDERMPANVPFFDFKLTGANDAAIAKVGERGITARAVLGQHDDLAVFSLIRFDETDMEKGDLIFNISEVFPGEDTETMMWNSVKYTDKTITVKVHLTDEEGLGKITPVVTVEGEDVELFTEDENDVLTIAGEFENEYIAVGDFTINSAKRIVDTDGDTSEDHTIPFELWHKDEHDKSMEKDKSAKVFISREVTITDATTDEGKTKFDYPLRFTLEARPEQLDAEGNFVEGQGNPIKETGTDGEETEVYLESIPNLLKANKAHRVQTTDGKQAWEIEYVLDEVTVVDQQLKPPDQTFDVVLTVVDDGAGKLAVTQMKYRNIYKNPDAAFKTVSAPASGEDFTQFTFDDTEIFRNTERRDAAPVEIAGIKHLEGREMTGNDVWTFTIEGVPAEGETAFTGPLPDPASVNNRGGLFEFNEIIFTAKQLGACDYTEDGSYYCQPKSYTYRVTESGTVEGVKNDTVKEFTVTVSEDKYGDVQVDIIDEGDNKHIHAVDKNGVPTGQFLQEIEKQLTFTNTYGEDQISIRAKKNFKGDWPSGQEFTFTITPMDGAPALEQSSVTVSREEPERSFGTLSFKLNEITEAMNASGSDKVIYKYQIREEIPDNADETNIKYDSRVYTLTVTVRVNDQNQLVITTDPSASNGVFSFTFTNEIAGETTPTAPHFFRMPETGFSALRPTVLDEQPKDISYRPLAWTLEIPSLELMTEIVEVPMHGDEYPVTWLGGSAGLLEGYALPGRGTSILTGHNHLNTTEAGPFALLKGMEIGDRIFVLDPQDGLQVFTVYANERIDGSDVQGLERIAERYENALTLLTCEDELPEGGYAHRRVIAAKPL